MARQSPSQRVATQPQRERALQRAEEVGAAQAARELGLRASTIRAWRSRARPAAEKASPSSAAATEAPVPPAEPDEIERLERLLQAERNLAIHAMSESRKALQAGRTMDAQRTATVHGIASDKCERLEARLQQARAARVMLARQQAQRIAQVITVVLTGLGLESVSEVSTLVRDVLGQAGSDIEVLTATPSLVEDARCAVRDHLRPAIEQELRDRLRAEAERAPRQLEAGPSPAPVHPDGEWAERFDSEEVVTGELVEPDQHAFAIPYEQIDLDHLDPEAEQAWQTLARRHARSELAEHEFKRWWTDRAERYRGDVASRLPRRPSAARVNFGHPGMR